jgi:8-oxo-dGTP pyrophosphatase MutT (NUDIX family)
MTRDSHVEHVIRETSAGGVVLGTQGLLLVKVKNLQGTVLWTLPKGHLEAGETAEQAALREVKEETGWNCRALEPFFEARYSFRRDNRRVDKSVQWFRMDPLEKAGEPDPDEILDCRWYPLREARDLLTYKSDVDILNKLEAGI